MRASAFVALLIVLLAAAACSGEGATGSAPSTDTGDTNEPPASAPASAPDSDPPTVGAELPADMPVDVPDGGRVDGVFPPVAGTLQDSWVVRVLYAPETADALVEFYDSWFADEGMEVETSRNDRVARWNDRTDHPLTSVTVNFEDAFYDGNNRLEITYDAEE